MLNTGNPYNLSDLSALKNRAGEKIAASIQNASAKTGVDFSYLLQQAKVESNFNSNAQAKTSSATGLFQFIEATWLSMVKEHGAKYGLSDYASKISNNGTVASASDKAAILALRKDPQIASCMAAEYAKENQDHLKNTVGGDIGCTELYLAHFMGAGGASKFIDAYRDTPNAKAASLFPDEAKANKAVFYNANGSSKTVSEVYAFFDKKFTIDESGAATQLAGQLTGTSGSATTGSIKTASITVNPNVNRPSRVDVFDETSGTWVKSSNQNYIDATLALLNDRPAQNYGGLPLLNNLISNPIDILSIAELTDTNYNYNRARDYRS